MSKRLKKAAFFFGSGISLKAGAPGVLEITRSLLEDKWSAHTDYRFYPGAEHDDGEGKRLQEFLNVVKTYIDQNLSSREQRKANYEDVYSAVLQMFQDETHDITNPLILDAIKVIRRKSKHLENGAREVVEGNQFASLLDRAVDLIQWVIFHRLNSVSEPNGLDVITSIAEHYESDFFTLNHDVLLEKQLSTSGIAYSDGFNQKNGDVSPFTGWNNGSSTRIFKLHGSIDWYRLRFPQYVQYAKISGDPENLHDANGVPLSMEDVKPLFLTGTTVKEQNYGLSLTGDLFAEFRARLKNHHTLICCGYGWMDKGINSRLLQWLFDDRRNKVVILHEGNLQDVAGKRFWRYNWSALEQNGKVLIHPAWLANCKFQDLEPYL